MKEIKIKAFMMLKDTLKTPLFQQEISLTREDLKKGVDYAYVKAAVEMNKRLTIEIAEVSLQRIIKAIQLIEDSGLSIDNDPKIVKGEDIPKDSERFKSDFEIFDHEFVLLKGDREEVYYPISDEDYLMVVHKAS